MRIAVWHNLPTGGGLRALGDQLRGLAARGHDLHVWAPPSAARVSSIDVAKTSREVALRRPDARSGLLRELGATWRGRRDDLDALDAHAAHCAREISEVDADIVLAHPCQFSRVPAIAQHLDLPSVLYLQEPNRRLYEATFGFFPWAADLGPRTIRPRSIRRFVEEFTRVELSRIQVGTETAWIHAFDEVLVNSSFTRESVLKAYGRLSRVSPLGVDPERFGLQARPEHARGTVLSVGALVVEKNAEFLVRAVGAAGPTVHRFIWVANYVDDRYRRVVERTAAAAGVSLDLRRSVSDDDLLRSCAEADVFVYAPRLEPFGLAPLEANATGLPVVAVAEGGVRETIEEGVNGMLVEQDEALFGAAIASLLADTDRARALGRSAREHVVQRWPVAVSIERLEAHLLSVLSGTAPDHEDQITGGVVP
jgi:glycosyltransferase involved in cell wall biosynthesis